MISSEYRATLLDTHAKYPKWGTSARKQAGVVEHLIESIDAKSVLDYGCGKGELFKTITPPNMLDIQCYEYDPGILSKSTLICDEPVDLVCCLDVLEHIEPEHLHEVLEDIKSFIGKLGLFVISTRTASGMLSDGRNAHLIVKSANWWNGILEPIFGKMQWNVNPARCEVTVIVASDNFPQKDG